MRLLNLAVPAVMGVTILSGCGNGSTKSPEGDVAVTVCAADPGGGKPKAAGNIVNHTSKPSGYTFRVKFLDASGNEVSQVTNAVARVETNGTATWTATGGISAKGPLTCKLDNVTRTAVGA